MVTTRRFGCFCLALLFAAGRLDAMRLAEPVDDPVYDDEVHVERWEDLHYPSLALIGRVQGSVVVSATLRDDGSVATASAVSGARTLIDASVENVKRWKFAPNAKKKVVVIYIFSIEGACYQSNNSLFRLGRANIATILGCTAPL